LSVWAFTTNGFTATSATVTFRYDDAALANTGKTADSLLVKGYTNSVWVKLPATLDPGAKTLTLSGAPLYPQYAVDLQSSLGTIIVVE
jgi:ABC-type thiamine transport system substrate-binding protein